ncbi:uncharacterized protein LOC122512072 isoform X1 [Leptopilina heterotoma]|uniref:uncharacterized protein LOC122512072 isoform X1 n=1 Tax=Leptopilina heterotoma TaxID=63436 RepID=UPI001CA9686D|nr:uncharacterized protein LOC122512072 isoform X1 [Leptopilina heterotoma]
MLIHILTSCFLLTIISGQTSSKGIKPTNILGGSEQHASFSFIRPGLTQTSFSFHGPSSHQTFSSSVGNPHLIHKVQPNVAQALRYNNPGLASSIYSGESVAPVQPPQFPYQFAQNPALIGYLQQAQQQFPFQGNVQLDSNIYQAQLLKDLSFKHPQLQTHLQIPEQIQLQQQQELPIQNLLGVAYSVAPSVSRVKVNGNGYKFDF